eukprot:gb/GECH01006271.1/.p1 GENE.gb/GECH01006271.1/~~gb/GECH01006271.1/.p1  ORF type:complete len:484 (+),score=108.84 gb/GECH01006271.1/:1-1452(+)
MKRFLRNSFSSRSDVDEMTQSIFSAETRTVIDKLAMAFTREQNESFINLSSDEKKTWAKLLSNKKTLVETFLNPNVDETIAKVNNSFPLNPSCSEHSGEMSDASTIKDKIESQQDLEKNLNTQENSALQHIEKTVSSPSMSQISIDISGDDNDDHPWHSLPVYLIFTDANIPRRDIKEMMNPFLEKLDLPSRPGKNGIRVALVIGQWWLEWNRTGLIVPKRCVGLPYRYAAEGIVLDYCPIAELHGSVASAIVHWNTMRNRTDHAVDFILEVLKSMENKNWKTIIKSDDSLVKQYLSRMKQSVKKQKIPLEVVVSLKLGSRCRSYQETNSLVDSNGIANVDATQDGSSVLDRVDSQFTVKSKDKGETMVDFYELESGDCVSIKNHRQIDSFIYCLLALDPYRVDLTTELTVLRMLDAIFWLHSVHMEKQKNNEYKSDSDDFRDELDLQGLCESQDNGCAFTTDGELQNIACQSKWNLRSGFTG